MNSNDLQRAAGAGAPETGGPDRRVLYVIVAVALVARLVFAACLGSNTYWPDEERFAAEAQRVASGQEPGQDCPPLYVLYLAGVRLISGDQLGIRWSNDNRLELGNLIAFVLLLFCYLLWLYVPVTLIWVCSRSLLGWRQNPVGSRGGGGSATS